MNVLTQLQNEGLALAQDLEGELRRRFEPLARRAAARQAELVARAIQGEDVAELQADLRAEWLNIRDGIGDTTAKRLAEGFGRVVGTILRTVLVPVPT